MNVMLKLFKGPLKKLLIRELKNNRDLVIKLANDKIDIPKLSEE